MKTLQPKFVLTVPETLEEGILYISMEYCSAIHKCICGCGYEVVTPISPSDWQLYFDGETVSLTPSIGNWSSDCKSHYFITNNKIIMSRKYSEKEIKAVRKLNKPKKKKKMWPWKK
jgi:hypothetical protein